MSVDALIKQIRQRAQLTQAQLAQRTGIAVPNISAIEAGRRVPRFDTVEVLLRGMGVRLLPVEQGLNTVFEVSAFIHEYFREGDIASCFRQWLQLGNELQGSDGVTRLLLAYQAPSTTGSQQWDAAIAALVEYRLNVVGVPLPHWLSEPRFSLAQPETLLVHEKYNYPVDPSEVAPEFLKRNILFPAESLVSY